MDILNPQPIKEKRPTGRTPRYTPEYYMVMAKQVVDDGMTYREAARVYNCSHGAVHHWTKLYRSGGLTKRVSKEKMSEASKLAHSQRIERYVKELKTEIGELYLENLMLKKALEYSRQLKKEDSSVITSENLDQFQEPAK